MPGDRLLAGCYNAAKVDNLISSVSKPLLRFATCKMLDPDGKVISPASVRVNISSGSRLQASSKASSFRLGLTSMGEALYYIPQNTDAAEIVLRF